jgi:hypothetical protein
MPQDGSIIEWAEIAWHDISHLQTVAVPPAPPRLPLQVRREQVAPYPTLNQQGQQWREPGLSERP